MPKSQNVPQSPASEPIVTTGTITAAVTALLALVVAFGGQVSEEQQVAILGVVAVAAPVVVALLGRRSVVEYTSGGQVRSGAASEHHTGDYVRPAGSLATAGDADGNMG